MIPNLAIDVLFVLFMFVAVMRPVWAVAVIIIGLPSYLLKAQVAGFPFTWLELAVLGTVFGWTARIVIDYIRNVQSLRDRVLRVGNAVPRSLIVAVNLTLIGWMLATIVSIDIRASLGALKAWLLEPLALGMLIFSELKTSRDRRFLERALLIALTWVSVAGLVQFIAFRSSVEDGRLSSVFTPVANYFAMFAVPLIVCATGFLMIRTHRRFAMVAAVIGITALALSFSYGGFLSLGIGLLVLIATIVPAAQRRRLVASLALFGLLAFVVLLPTRYFQEKLNFSTRSSSLVRTQIWRTAWEIGTRHPLFGIGPGTFEKAFREVAPTLYHPPLEWLVAKPHNLYLNLWVETGLLGLIGTIGVFVVVFKRVFVRITATAMSKVYGAALVAIAVHGLVDTPIFKNDLAVFTVVIVVLGLLSVTLQNHTTADGNMTAMDGKQ